MAGQITKTKVVAATVARPAVGTVVVTYQGGQDAATLSSLNVTINDVDVAKMDGSGTPEKLSVGTSKSYTIAAATTDRIHVVVIGNFQDASNQVILDTFI
jgi:hypothetical protein